MSEVVLSLFLQHVTDFIHSFASGSELSISQYLVISSIVLGTRLARKHCHTSQAKGNRRLFARYAHHQLCALPHITDVSGLVIDDKIVLLRVQHKMIIFRILLTNQLPLLHVKYASIGKDHKGLFLHVLLFCS